MLRNLGFCRSTKNIRQKDTKTFKKSINVFIEMKTRKHKA